jgi:hypothetical protein
VGHEIPIENGKLWHEFHTKLAPKKMTKNSQWHVYNAYLYKNSRKNETVLTPNCLIIII